MKNLLHFPFFFVFVVSTTRMLNSQFRSKRTEIAHLALFKKGGKKLRNKRKIYYSRGTLLDVSIISLSASQGNRKKKIAIKLQIQFKRNLVFSTSQFQMQMQVKAASVSINFKSETELNENEF